MINVWSGSNSMQGGRGGYQAGGRVATSIGHDACATHSDRCQVKAKKQDHRRKTSIDICAEAGQLFVPPCFENLCLDADKRKSQKSRSSEDIASVAINRNPQEVGQPMTRPTSHPELRISNRNALSPRPCREGKSLGGESSNKKRSVEKSPSLPSVQKAIVGIFQMTSNLSVPHTSRIATPSLSTVSQGTQTIITATKCSSPKKGVEGKQTKKAAVGLFKETMV